jgi:hypothetical protein
MTIVPMSVRGAFAEVVFSPRLEGEAREYRRNPARERSFNRSPRHYALRDLRRSLGRLVPQERLLEYGEIPSGFKKDG